jgi:hypothetical protein
VSASRRLATIAAVLALGLGAFTAAIDAETILLPRPVPSFNQNYTDGPDAWGRCALGTGGCPDRIATTGCLVTAIASILAYYEIDVSVPAAYSCTGRARTGMDPGILNDWLQAHGAYGHCASDPVGSCCLVWDRLPDGVGLTYYSNRSDDGLNPISSVVIDHALRSGEPIVAGVHWSSFCRPGSSQSEDCHWIVLTGKIGDTYTIVDPMNPDATDSEGVRTTLDAGTRGAYILDRFAVVSSVSAPASQESADAGLPTTADTGNQAASGLAILAILGALIAILLIATRKN